MGERNELKNRCLHLDYDRLFGASAAALHDEGCLERIGPKRGGRWHVL